MKELTGLQIQRARGVEVQIQEYLRRLIVSGEIKSGTRLPPTGELAGLWSAGVQTVQNALRPLVKEGLLVRRPKAGTFVRQREKKLTCVGIYGGASYAESAFGHAVQAALREELQRAGIEPDIWTDPRPASQRVEPWMPMVRAAEQREFQALIVANAAVEYLPWLRKLPVPVTARGGMPDMPSRVDIDFPQMAEAGLQALAAQGCRSAGLIMPINPWDGAAEGKRSRWLDFCERFLQLAGELRLAVRNDWMRLLRQNVDPGTARAHEQYGYEEFLQVWRQSERPAGLVVYDDATARGVILAVRERQVRVPEDLKLVLHKNEATDLFCPMPATFLVLSEREIARALIAQMQKQFRGEQCELISVPLRVIAHPGNSQQPTTPTQEGSQL